MEDIQEIEAKDTYTIWAGNMPLIQEKLDKLAKTAKKLGVAPVTVEVISTTSREVCIPREDRDRCKAPMISREGKLYAIVEEMEIKVIGTAPKLAGWTIIARLEMTDKPNVNLVHVAPGQTLPEKYRTTNIATCDHCKKPRHRRETFVVRHEDGTTLQVGRQCLKDFLGHTGVEAAIAGLWSFLTFTQEISEMGEYMGHGGGRTVYDTEMFLAHTAVLVRTAGYLSSAKAEQQMRASTAMMAAQSFNPKAKSDELIFPTPEDFEKAKTVIAWVRDEMANDSDYTYNLKLMIGKKYTDHKHIGYVASAIPAYNRAKGIEDIRIRHGKEWAEKLKNMAYVGEIGKRQDFKLLVTGLIPVETAYGISTLVKFEDESGNQLTWFASGTPQVEEKVEVKDTDGWFVQRDLVQGRWYKVKATVKAHELYKEVPQTKITRAKVTAA